jgi:hypothetical protein
MVLAIQQIGGGGTKAILLGGILDLCPAALWNQSSPMEEDLCLIQRRVGLEQLEEKVELEIQFSEREENGESGIDVSGDTGWDKYGTDSNCYLDSGYHLITGI